MAHFKIVYGSRASLHFVKIGEVSAVLHGVDVILPSSLSSFEISENRSDFVCIVYGFCPVWMQLSTVDACAWITQSV